jgi:hypothetical protein
METNIKKLINDIIDSKIKELRNELSDLRKWKKFDSVTDQYSPITGASGQIGFFGTSKISKPTVSGSRGSNAALASLLTALSNLGLITDQSS